MRHTCDGPAVGGWSPPPTGRAALTVAFLHLLWLIKGVGGGSTSVPRTGYHTIRLLHISYTQSIFTDKKLLKGLLKARFPVSFPLPAYLRGDRRKKMQAGATVKTKGLIAEGRGESNRVFQQQEGSHVTSLETTSSQKEKFWKRIWGWDSGGEDWK